MLKSNSGSQLFIEKSEISNWILNFNETKSINLNHLKVAFKGAQSFEEEVPYKWQLLYDDSFKYIHFIFEKDDNIDCGIARINESTQQIDLQLKVKKEKKEITLDPFFHPIGILILQFIVHNSKGFVMHASAVNYKNMGFLFSAVSGTGKSTMARLWQEKGATIINDDRIIVRPNNGNYYLHNTPMPYYKDENKKVKLQNLFIIKQSTENYIKPLSTTNGTLSILSNCIQYHFNETQIKERLDYIAKVVQKHKVYVIGFKPDTSIIDLIIKEFGQK
ncbi:hypothetical protein [Carboxylicivirga linearis]|uniref:SynChlorMet cassette protein ScmC n=1 Tax=Carboxylicivirga linearis TaxID=1628157 RepID=A0ABS5K0P5_9BACT|nr:hypothetical protein [Carboxylicivirga linearis]MBS2100246.1 hypothetical protein [Carboxylicivirga linearis]